MHTMGALEERAMLAVGGGEKEKELMRGDRGIRRKEKIRGFYNKKGGAERHSLQHGHYSEVFCTMIGFWAHC